MSNADVRPPFSFFADRAQEPSRRSVLGILGNARDSWNDLETHLAEAYRLKGFVHFMYGERYGWALRFQRGGRTVLAMYPNRGVLTVQIILSRAQVAAATAMGLPRRVARVLETAKDYPEGRWLFIPVESLANGRELRPLIELKLSPPKSSRARVRS
jgi:hypothetical protein